MSSVQKMKNANILICIPTLNRYDRLFNCVNSLNAGTRVPGVCIIDNGNGLDKNWGSNFPDMDIEIISFGKNIGVSASWNWFINNKKLPMLISNDDIIFGEYDIYNFQYAYYSDFDAVLFRADNVPELNMFSCFMPTNRLIMTVGMFDEKFYPAYFEDNDYRYRMKLAGFDNKISSVKTNLAHYTSSTLAGYSPERMMKHHDEFRRNRAYYEQKWGGLPGNELYDTPFNGVDKSQ